LFSPAIKTLVATSLLAVPLAPQDAPAFRSNVEIVVVPLSVVDGDGHAVGGLTRDEFRVYDNDVRRPIESFWFDADQPLTLGVVIDASESQKEQLAEHRRTTVDLLERILRPGDRAFVVSVDDSVRLWVDVTTAPANIRDALAAGPVGAFGQPCAPRNAGIAGLRAISSCGSSPLWNAIYDGALLKLRPLSGSKALLVLTDGFDSGSSRTWQQAADAASQADAGIYAIQYRSGFGRSFAPDLYRLVTEAGGTWFSPPDGDTSPIVARIETDLRHRYVLGFRPERLSGKVRHKIRVEVARPDVTVRARRTYFQQP
jgi:VWFA-related protein